MYRLVKCLAVCLIFFLTEQLFHLLLKGFRQCDHIRLSPFVLKFVCNCLCAVSLCNQIQFFVEPF